MSAMGFGRTLGWAAAVVALVLVFAAWLNPHLAVEFSNLVAGCFQ